MLGKVYQRPLLCRLCECPAVDGGVPLQKDHLEKLSRWTKAQWDTDFDDVACIVCHFCVWDMRFSNQHSEEKESDDQIWWPKCEKQNNLHQQYYTDELMKPCSVKIELLRNESKLLEEFNYQRGISEQNQNLANRLTSPGEFAQRNISRYENKAGRAKQDQKSLKCFFCGKVSSTRAIHRYHLKAKHRFELPKLKGGAKPKILTSGKYFCCVCDRYFESKPAQWQHMHCYHKNEAFKCIARGCANYFKTKEDVQNHVQEQHADQFKCMYCNTFMEFRHTIISNHMWRYHKGATFRCEINPVKCYEWFKTEQERQNHYEETHKSGRCLCPFCGKRFANRTVLCTHSRKHHPKEKIHFCDYHILCTLYFSNEADKLKHVKEVHENHDEKLRCVYCDKFVMLQMSTHVNKWHKDVAIKCNFKEHCPNYFKTLEDRDKHVREVHQAEKMREAAPCVYCDKVFAEERTMRMHIRLMHPELVIRCQFVRCGVFFKSQEDLENHLSLYPRHRNISKKEKVAKANLYNCALCVNSYKEKTSMINHWRNYHNRETCPHCQKPCDRTRHILTDFCKVCNQKFRCLGLLKSHTKNCTADFQCLVCSKSFKKEHKLNYHCKRFHTVPILQWKRLQFKSRGFKCDECFSYFGSRNILRTHARLLHGPTVCTCDFCKIKFANKERLKGHIERNHLPGQSFGRKIVQCPVCNLKLKSKTILKGHIKKNH